MGGGVHIGRVDVCELDESMLTMIPYKQPEETLSLLATILPPTLTFVRKPIAAPVAPAPEPVPEPPLPRSPSLAANAASSQYAEPVPPAPEPVAPISLAIFGSVSAHDILAVVKEALAVDSEGGRVALEEGSISILGLEEGEDRIKRLGTFEIEISPGKDLDPVRRTVEVVPDQ